MKLGVWCAKMFTLRLLAFLAIAAATLSYNCDLTCKDDKWKIVGTKWKMGVNTLDSRLVSLRIKESKSTRCHAFIICIHPWRKTKMQQEKNTNSASTHSGVAHSRTLTHTCNWIQVKLKRGDTVLECGSTIQAGEELTHDFVSPGPSYEFVVEAGGSLIA